MSAVDRKPDAFRADPWWLLAQAAAWIATRDRGDVAEAGPHGTGHDGIRLAISNAWDQCSGKTLPSPTEAEDLLLTALGAGEITARVDGLTIAPDRWSQTRLFEKGRGPTVEKWLVDPRGWKSDTTSSNAVLSADDVRSLWPEPPPSAHWTASEAMTFLAFGKPETNEWVTARTRQILAQWNAPNLEIIAGWLEQAERDGIKALGPEQVAYFERRLAAIEEAEHFPITLIELLPRVRADLAEQRALNATEAELIEACRAEKVRCWGDRNNAPNELSVLVPSNAWMQGVTIRHDAMTRGDAGTMEDFCRVAEKQDALFSRLTFASADVMALRLQASLPTPSSNEPNVVVPNAKRTRAGGRPAKYDWASIKPAALERLRDEGLPGDGSAEKAEFTTWLRSKLPVGSDPSDSAVRSFAKNCIETVKREIDAMA